MTRPRNIIALLVALLALAAPTPVAASAVEAGADCVSDGDLDGTYTRDELEQALEDFPSDQDQYTDGRACLEDALQKLGRNRGSSGSGGGAGSGPGGFGAADAGGLSPTAATPGTSAGSPSAESEASRPEDVNALADALRRTAAGPGAINVGGEGINPRDAGNSIPLALLLALICVGALAAAGAGTSLWQHRAAIRGVALRLIRR